MKMGSADTIACSENSLVNCNRSIEATMLATTERLMYIEQTMKQIFCSIIGSEVKETENPAMNSLADGMNRLYDMAGTVEDLAHAIEDALFSNFSDK